MKRSVLPVLMGFALLLLSSTEGWSLPPCPGSPTSGWSTARNWTDCLGTFTSKGEKYVGEFKNGLPHGQGTYTYHSGNKYVGEWKNGKENGQGTYTYADGDKYVGEYRDGKRNGQGTFTHANGDKYVGEWKNGKRNGHGIVTFASGDKYVGGWKDGKQHGQGTYTFTDGNKYVGEWKNGKKNGQGNATYASGDKYVGGWKNGKRNGQGTYTRASGSKTVGEWKDGHFWKGQGTYTYHSGNKYVGELKNGKKNGQGTYTYADGRKYVGEWKDGKYHEGTYTYANGDKYVGEFRKGIKHGHGTFTYADGDKFVGEFNNGIRHGQGTFTFTDGKVEESNWENGRFLYANKPSPTVTAKKSPTKESSLRPCWGSPSSRPTTIKSWIKCFGTYTAPNGHKYVGEFEFGKKHGQGTDIWADGRVVKGNWENGRFLYAKKPKPVQKVPKRPDDIAVIIANSNYTKQGKGIPNVTPAYNDAENIKKYFMESLGVREGNIIYLKDATGAQLTEVFGNKENHKAQLFNWVRPNKSNVHIYYAGHGAPASKDGSAYLVPTDAKSQTIEFSGYLLTNLYRNLKKIRARSVTVILEACFSGFSQGGAVLPRSSGIMVVARQPTVPSNVRVISAGAADQMASWEQNGSQSLFTKYFLKGMSGEGDKKPYGNGDGKVEDRELKKYLDDTMTYYARRYYGRDQTAQIVVNGKELSPTN